VLIAGLALVSLAMGAGLQAGREAAYPTPQRPAERLLYTRSAAALKRLSLEFDGLVADVYWIRALQHYGADRLDGAGANQFALLEPLLDLTTSLDPFFTIAYRFGAIFLSEPPPGGPGRPESAIRLLEKGIAAQPSKWQYPHDIAFVHYWHLHDPAAAAAWFQRAAAVPGAPEWLRPVAATMLSGTDRGAARVLWEQILKSDQSWLRRTAERSLLQLEALDQVEQLQAVVDRASIPAGQRVTWNDLVRRGVMRGLPVDSTGTPFSLDPDTRKVTVAPGSPLLPMPEFTRPTRPPLQ
jgi:hypothetical protein